MPYEYAKEKPEIFKEENTKTMLTIRDNGRRLTRQAGCFRADKAWQGCTGSSWLFLAVLDYLVETNEIVRVTPAHFAGQDQIFHSRHED